MLTRSLSEYPESPLLFPHGALLQSSSREPQFHRNTRAEGVEVYARLLCLLLQHRDEFGIRFGRDAQVNATGHRSEADPHSTIDCETTAHVDIARNLYLQVENR